MTRASIYPRADRILLHAGFIFTGMVTTILGPLLPLLASRWLLSDAKAGSLFAAQFLGSFLGGLSISVLLPRQGFRSVLVTGFLVMAGGVGCLGLGPWPVGRLATFAYGIGLGIVIPAANLYICEAAPERRAAALNILNLSWGIGAVTCPVLISLLESRVGLPTLLMCLGAILAVCAAALARQAFTASPEGPVTSVRSAASPRGTELGAAVWALAALFFLYVGTENALSGWVSTHAKRMGSPVQTLWVITPSVFWGALLMGRALAPVALRYVAEAKLAAAALAIASCGTLAVLLSRTVLGVRLGAGAAGLGLAPVYPMFIAWLGHRFRAEAAGPGGVMFALASLGGATLPWLVGAVSTRFTSLQAGLLIPLTGCLLMLAALPLAYRGPSVKAVSGGAPQNPFRQTKRSDLSQLSVEVSRFRIFPNATQSLLACVPSDRCNPIRAPNHTI